MVNIQMLGHAEPPLIALEQELIRAEIKKESVPHAMMLTQCLALSMYWVFGLYEVLRTLRERAPDNFGALASLFTTVEVLRMPLAKHQVKGAKGYRHTEHHPRGTWDPSSGRVGWLAFDPFKEELVPITRRHLADQFLAVPGPDKA